MQQPETPKRDHQQIRYQRKDSSMEGKSMLPFPSLVRELIMDHRGRTSRKTGDHILFHCGRAGYVVDRTAVLHVCVTTNQNPCRVVILG